MHIYNGTMGIRHNVAKSDMDSFADTITCFHDTQKDYPLSSIFLNLRDAALPASATLLLFQGFPLTRLHLPGTFLNAPCDVKTAFMQAISELKSEPVVVLGIELKSETVVVLGKIILHQLSVGQLILSIRFRGFLNLK